MFVANTTQQFHEFVYRVPEGQKTIIQRIPPGGQIRISAKRGDLNRIDVDDILDQHRKYGMVREDEIGKVEGLCGLVCAIDRPVNLDKVIAQIRRNRSVLVEQGRQAREAAAVSINHQIEANIAAMGSPDVLRNLEYSVEEVKSATVRDRVSRADNDGMTQALVDTPAIGEGVRVSNDAPPPLKPGRTRLSGGRARRS